MNWIDYAYEGIDGYNGDEFTCSYCVIDECYFDISYNTNTGKLDGYFYADDGNFVAVFSGLSNLNEAKSLMKSYHNLIQNR